MTTDWNPLLRDQFEQPYWSELMSFVDAERDRYPVYPPRDEVFAALHHTSFQEARVVKPPSVANIHRELHDDLGLDPPDHGNLEAWAANGVLLLNTTLTVRAGEAGSHRGRGWERFTDRVIEVVSGRDTPVVFVLWGSAAREKRSMIDTSRHAIVESIHPSPLSAHRGFLGSRPFSKVNSALIERGSTPIDWTLS